MADYTDDRLTYGQLDSEPFVENSFAEAKTKVNLQETEAKRRKATVGDKADAMWKQFSNSHLAAKALNNGYENLIAGEYPEDELWKKEKKLDDEGLFQFMVDNGISPQYEDVLDRSNSEDEFAFRLQRARTDMNTEKSIDENIGSTARTISSVGASFLGIETLAFGVAGKMYTSGSSVAKIAMYEGAVEASYVAAQLATDENYHVSNIAGDVLVGLGASVGMAKLSHRFGSKPSQIEANVNAINEQGVDINTGKKTKINTETGAVEERGIDVPVVVHTKKGVQGTLESVVNLNKKDRAELDRLKKEADEVDTANESRGKSDYRKKKIKKLEEKTAKQDTEIQALEKKINLNDKELELETKAEDVDMQTSADELANMNKTAADIETMKEAEVQVKSEHPELNDLDGIKTKEDMDAFKEKIRKSTTLNRKQKIAVIAALGLGATSLSADDGSAVAASTIIPALVIASVVGVVGLRALRSGNAKQWMKDVQNRVAKNIDNSDVLNSQEGRATAKLRESTAEAMHTKLTSTLAGFTGKAEEIMSKLLWSAKTGWGTEVQRLMDVRSHAAKYQLAENTAYKSWAKHTNTQNTLNIAQDVENKRLFREDVMNYMENRNSDIEGFPEFAEEIDNLMKQMYDKNKAYGTHGFDKIEYVKGMMPRLWKTGNINNILGQLSDVDLASVKKAFTKAIHEGDIAKRASETTDINAKPKKPITMADSEAKAEKLVQGWKDMPLGDSARTADDSLTAVTQYLKDDVDLDDVLKSLNQSKDKHSRTHHRLNMDLDVLRTELKGLQLDGGNIDLDMNMFLDRDVKNVFDKTSNQLHSSSAMSSAGYTSKQQLIDAINASGATTKQKKEMMQVADLMNGNVPNINSDVMHNFSLVSKDLMVITKLGLSPISTSQEILNMLGTHGLIKTSRELAKNFKKTLGTRDKLGNQLVDMTGQATNGQRYDPTHQGFSDDILGSEDVDITSSIRKGTMKMRDLVLLPLGGMTDMIQGAALKLDADMLAKKLTGMDEGSGYRWDGVGISDDIKTMFSNEDFKFEDGTLTELNMNGWNLKKKDAFRQMVFNMNQRISLEQTLGESPLFSRTSDLGRAMTGLLGYGMGEFNVHKVQDVRHMDRMAFTHSVAAFSAVYISTYMRASLNGKEVDEDRTLRYAIMASLPPASALALAKSFTDPAMFDAPSTIMNVLSTGQDR